MEQGIDTLMRSLFYYPTTVEIETRKRIRVAVLAFAYEFGDKPLATDAEFDKLAQSIDLSVNTQRPDMDEWFRKEFEPDTGMWIHKHPQLDRIGEIYAMQS